jgi:hypothetical protein
MVDYTQRYDTVALGKTPANIGNIILIALVAALILGGGFFVLKREGLINVSFEDPKRVPVTEKYPADVVELLPGITKLKPASRRILKEILAKPKIAANLLTSIDRLTHEEPADNEPAGEVPADERSTGGQTPEDQEE